MMAAKSNVSMAWLRASLKVWQGRVKTRKALHVRAQRDLDRARQADEHPRKALVDRRDRRAKQLEEARAMVARRQREIEARTTKTAIRPGGRYRGSEGIVDSLRRIGGQGLAITSAKRQNTNPFSGRGSDHDHRNADAYANDLSNGSSPTPGMDQAAYNIMRALGFTDYDKGEPINTQRGVRTLRTPQGTFRVQVIYRGSGAAFGGNHLNHIHIGVKRIG